ncbi:MAG: FecR domain-containing protein [Planctomycetes bacterium]|nr:FecR domain-containing protein [Planctomycetota bacterium]
MNHHEMIESFINDELDEKGQKELALALKKDSNLLNELMRSLGEEELISQFCDKERSGESFMKNLSSRQEIEGTDSFIQPIEQDDGFVKNALAYIQTHKDQSSIHLSESSGASRRLKRAQRQGLPWAYYGVASVAACALLLILLQSFFPWQPKIYSNIQIAGDMTQVKIYREGQALDWGDIKGVMPGDVLITGDAQASLNLIEEDTKIDVKANTHLELISMASNQPKIWRLIRGGIRASVEHQQEGAPLIIRTPFSTATVVGTIFYLDVDNDKSVLKVTEGKVRHEDWSGKYQDLVEAGNTSTIMHNVASTDQQSVPQLLIDGEAAK